jgi:hypothetical protein
LTPVGRAITTLSGKASANPCAQAAAVKADTDELRASDRDPLVDGVHQVCLLLCYFRAL